MGNPIRDELISGPELDAEIEAFKRDVDTTLLRENLKLSVTERVRKHFRVAQFVEKLRLAGELKRGTP